MKSSVNSLQGFHFAFTRLELLACLAASAMLTTIIVPVLANSGARSDRVTCFNNLRQIGVGYSQFGLEHQDLPPWRLSMAQGGNANAPGKDNLYIQFSIISNYLGHPRVLRDPVDRRPGAQVAQYWDNRSDGGLHRAAYRNKAVSYFLGLDGTFFWPHTVLSGDRNLLASPNANSCSTGVNPASELRPWTTGWTNDVHGIAGNIAFYDGSVAQVDSAGLRSALGAGPLDIAGAGSGAIHVLPPF